jgi:AcrR family transcriptional regulator
MERLFHLKGKLASMSHPDGSADHDDRCDSTLRADAQRNRARIVDAARRVFAEDGLGASLNEVARRAGVGVATLFRRFPTREDLIAATFADSMARYAALIETALADPDPWHGFCDYVRAVCAMQAGDRGFTDVLTRSFPSAKEFEVQRDKAFRRFTELIDRAKQTGGLREDFVAEDLPILLMANAGVVAATTGSAPETSPRLVAYLLQAFAAQAAEPLPEPPPPRRMYRALRRLANKDQGGR